jgi:hypothetical protein
MRQVLADYSASISESLSIAYPSERFPYCYIKSHLSHPPRDLRSPDGHDGRLRTIPTGKRPSLRQGQSDSGFFR